MVNNIILFFLSLILLCPVQGLFLNCSMPSRPQSAARWAGYSIGLAFCMSLALLVYLFFLNTSMAYLGLHINTLSLLLSSLVLFVSFVVHRFSLRYMDGDRLYRRFFIFLSALTFTAVMMMLADNLFLFWVMWSSSNVLLVLLMTHKKEWIASKNAGVLAFYTLGSSSFLLFMAFMLLMGSDGSHSIVELSSRAHLNVSSLVPFAMGLMLLAAMLQSALFPFHRWLMSSLNSPTPVSALMHAGLVNGGGIIIVKFSSFFAMNPVLLILLFLFGSVSALLGTIWKLMQHDIKKMLACSTVAQMGFMMMQCAVGLFAAAIAHICLHGLFKAYLFLSSGSAVTQTKSQMRSNQTSLFCLLSSILGGLMAMASFAFITDKAISFYEPSMFVLFFAFIAGAQLICTWFKHDQSLLHLMLGFVLSLFYGLMYGSSVHLIEILIPSLSTIQLPSLSILHWIVMMIFASLWFVFNFCSYKRFFESKLACWIYMNLFNASQPATKTMTALRSHYHY